MSRTFSTARTRAEAETRARLSADLEAIRAERGGVEIWHLTERGWTRGELDQHLGAVTADLMAKAA